MAGDLGVVVDTTTNKCAYVIYAEVGPDNRIGEMSIATFKGLGLSYSVGSQLTGIDSLRFITIMFPGSGKRYGYNYNNAPKNASEITTNGMLELKRFLDTRDSIGIQ